MSGNRGKGRPKGAINKTTAQAKEAIEAAFEHLQSKKGKSLKDWAELNTDDFYKLLFPRLLPVQMHHAGAGGGPVETVTKIQLVGGDGV